MPSPLEDLINKYAEGGSVKNPFAHLSGNYRLGKVTPEDIKAATEDFKGSYLPDMLTSVIQRIRHNEDFNQHANEYREMVNDLKKYYPTPREDRAPRDKASNYAGAYDYAQRVRHTEPMDNVINAAKGYQMYQDFGNGDRTNDAINDYLENKAGVEAAYADRDLPLKDREEILKNAVMFTEGQGYANGGSVEYNPITVDQIIDATHQELGTGRYAKGGSVENKMQAIPQNENLAALAEALSQGRDIANKVDIPYLGGVGDFLVGKTPEEIENWSYGNAPMQIPEMSNLPQFKEGRGESFADAATTLLPMAKGTKDFPTGLSFIGPKSKGWDKVAAELAAKKLDEGVDPAQVWQEHLIGRLPSGHLFSEISDKEAIPIPQKDWGWANQQEKKWGSPFSSSGISDYLSHPELHDQYSGMMDFGDSDRKLLMNVSPHRQGGSFDNDFMIEVGMDGDTINKSIALHELQHAIQQREGWPQGGSPNDISAYYAQKVIQPNINDLNKKIEEKTEQRWLLNGDEYKASVLEHKDLVNQRSQLLDELNNLNENLAPRHKLYKRLTGEAQARATQDRLDMDMAQRRESYPLAGDKLSDISLKDLIDKHEGDGPAMSIDNNNNNLNADLLEKYLVTGKLSPKDMALYEDNALMMEDPNLQRYNLENARAQIPDDMDRVSATGFTTPAYHSSRNQDDIYEFGNRIYDTSLFNGLGVHSGTKAAAKQRAEDTVGYNRDTGKRNPDMAAYYPLQLRANKSFEINGRPTDEYGSEIHLDSLGRPLGMGRETDTGRAAIQDAYFKNNDVLKYINDVEDKGSVSYISPPENIRSRFAAFDPLRKNSTSILANVLGGTALSDLALKYGDNEDVGYASGGAVVKGIKKLAKNLNEALLGKHLAGETLTPEEMIKYEKNALKMEAPNTQHFNVENAMAQPEREAYKAEHDIDFLHGTERLDRLLSKAGLDPKRATSGPMAFGTDSPAIASNYATGKKDTSIFDTDDWDYSKAYTVLPKDMGIRGTSPYTVEQSWNYLSPEVKKDILSKASRVGHSDIDELTGDLMLHPESQDAINKSHFDYLLKEHRNNPLAALRDYWVDSGNLYDEEQKLEDIYKLAGYPHPISQDTAPWASAPGVLLGRSRITNPLDTSNISELQEKVIPALKDAFKNDRSRLKLGVDQWDKNSKFTPKEWVNELESDVNKGENSFVFTSIPDKVTAALKDIGYNGIYDMGGKGGGASHQVTIPFEPS